MSMILDKEKNKIIVYIPNSEAIINSQLACMKDSEVTGYYINDKEEIKSKIVEFLNKDFEYVLDIKTLIEMLKIIREEIYNTYHQLYKGKMNELYDILNYFINLDKTAVVIPNMYYGGQGARYLRFKNDDAMIKKLREVLYGDITGFEIINYKNQYYVIKPFLKENWQEILETKKEIILKKENTIFEKFIKFHEKYSLEYKNNLNAQKLESEFLLEYPLERIKKLTLEEYALGTDNSKNSLSYKLEYGKYSDLLHASISGGSSNKFGIYLSNEDGWIAGNKKTNDPQKYWENLREQLYNALNESKNGKIYNFSSKYPLLKRMKQVILKLGFLYDNNNSYIGIIAQKNLVALCKIFKIYNKETKKLSTEELNHCLTIFLYNKFKFLSNYDKTYVTSLLWEYLKYINDSKEEVITSNKYLYPNIFINDETINEILSILERKKNIILQGPPGVGKTFIATSLLKINEEFEKVELIQFHQSYSYEDFVQGYKPTDKGTFERKNGIFYNLVEQAKKNKDKKYCLIIDEINRGNLSKIFGELLLLIEADKRNKKYEISLTYSNKDEPKFYIPDNLYIIGTMNNTDRSLTMFDYALRRRFSFINIEPAFNNDKFREYMLEKEGIEEEFLNKLINNMNSLNEKIEDELNVNFKIGHSYFVGALNLDNLIESYNQIITYEIKPLLEEYWQDEEKINDALSLVMLQDTYE